MILKISKERPILMSAPMVRATLTDLKLQTRRIIKNQQDFRSSLGGVQGWTGFFGWQYYADVSKDWSLCSNRKLLCPYGEPGDRLWVRETSKVSAYDFQLGRYPDEAKAMVNFRAGGVDWFKCPTGTKLQFKWTPSIFMPRWASRITLEVTEVRVQRLKNITYEDIKAEGWPGPIEKYPDLVNREAARDWWMDLWNSINGKRPGAAWDDNPWVWAITFRRIKP